MNTRVVIIIFVLFLAPGLAIGGDYELFITDDGNRICGSKEIYTEDGGCYTDAWRPICRVEEVIEDLERYFSGKSPAIEILVPAFGNGHVNFCSDQVRSRISQTLREIEKSGSNKRGRHLSDFLKVNNL